MNDEVQQYSRLDMAFADFLAARTKLPPEQKEMFTALVRGLSFRLNQGHSCMLIKPQELAVLSASGLASEADNTPLILEQDRLYLQRYWFYEKRLAQQLQTLIEQQVEPPDSATLTLLDRYFVDLIDETDWQREAAKQAIRQTLSIITGGPGTGKTTTVVKILALMQELARNPC